MFAPPKGKATDETSLIVRLASRFWSGTGPGVLRQAKMYGKRWIATIPADEFAGRYRGFSALVIGIDVGFDESPPQPFGNHIMGQRNTMPDVKLPPGFSPDVALAMFSAFVLENDKGTVRVEAHWWPSHEWIVNQRFTLSTKGPESQNSELEIVSRALEFFQLETRGTPKISEQAIKATILKLGQRATQKAVAKEIGVTEQGLNKWRARRGMSHGERLSAVMHLN